MRKEFFTEDSFVHIYNRGTKKQAIVKDEKDRWHFLQMLFYFNAHETPTDAFDKLRKILGKDFNNKIIWPEEWGKRNPLVLILAFVLKDNHFHLLLKEITKGGITQFMRKLGTSMASRFNIKYMEVGSLFEGPYRAKVVDDDEYLKYLAMYIMVKNTFEMYPGGFKKAIAEFEKAYAWTINYPYSSLNAYASSNSDENQIVEKDLLGEIFETPQQFKKFAQQCLDENLWQEKISNLRLD